MNSERSRDLNAELDVLLSTWKVDDALPPRFADQVWQRIARAEARGPEAFWPRFRALVVKAMSQPSLAVSYLLVLLMAGLLGGYWQARLSTERTSTAMGERYVRMMDPYQAPRH